MATTSTLSVHPLQRAQILRQLAEFPYHLGVAEFAYGGIAGAAEGHRATVAWFARQCFRAHDGRVWIETLDRFAGRDTVVSRDKRQRHEIGYIRHVHS